MNNLFKLTQAKGKWHKFLSFNLGRGAKLYKNFAQKLLAVSLCMAVVLLGVPRGQNFVEAADADAATIPNAMFLTKEALLKLCEETNSGTGLLATGTDSDVKLRINFGQRPARVTYTRSSWPPATAASGPTSWLVAGSETFTPAGQTAQTDGLVLFSEAPLVSAFNLRGASKMNSKFQPTYTDKIEKQYWVGSGTTKADFDDSWGTYLPGSAPSHVYADHWGASNLRKVLNAIYNGTPLTVNNEEANYAGFFNAPEKDLMAASEIKTNDHQTGSAVEYTTEDYLYAPRSNSNQMSPVWKNIPNITVGIADSLTIDAAHVRGISWLRSPHPRFSFDALTVIPGYGVGHGDILSVSPSISAAFRLNLSSVLFTSAASTASSAEGEKFSKISADTPMTLRLKAPAGSAAEVSAVGGTIGTKAAAGWTLMVQGVTADGQNWSYSKAIDSDDVVTVSAADVASAGSIELSSFDNCEVWLEQPVPDGGALTYAIRAEETLPRPDFFETSVDVMGQPQRIRVYDPHQVLPLDAQLKVEAVTSHEALDDTHEIEHLLAYNISLLDAAGNPLPMPLSDKVELCFEVLDGLDRDELEVVLVQEFDDAEFTEELVELDGASWVKVKTNHFSPYGLLDKLSPKEKVAPVVVAGLGMVLVLALGVMLRLIMRKNKFEE